MQAVSLAMRRYVFELNSDNFEGVQVHHNHHKLWMYPSPIQIMLGFKKLRKSKVAELLGNLTTWALGSNVNKPKITSYQGKRGSLDVLL